MTAAVPDRPRPSLPPRRRTPDLGNIPGLPERYSKDWSLGLFRQICFNRYFEFAVAKAVESKHIRTPVYLSAGSEHIPAALAAVLGQVDIFAQHRGHSYYLSFGGDPAALIDELLGRSTGCARGWGGSASIHDPKIGMWGHSGLMGDQIPIGVGYALASRKPTLIVAGDASGEEDYALAAMGYAATRKLPVLFVCEDNDLSILTPVAVRRSWSLPALAESFGMQSADITDDPWLIAHYAQTFRDSLPGYINVQTCRVLWHAGPGTDGPPEWDRFALIKQSLDLLGWAEECRKIERDSKNEVAALWDRQLYSTI